MSNGKYDPPLSKAGFMDLLGALQAQLKTPDAITILAAMPEDQHDAALQLGLLAQNYVEVVEGRSNSISFDNKAKQNLEDAVLTVLEDVMTEIDCIGMTVGDLDEHGLLADEKGKAAYFDQLRSHVTRARGFAMGGIKKYYPKDLPLNVEQENKIVAEADAAYLAAKASGQELVCPYRSRTYAHEIWSTRLIDAPLVFGHSNDDFEVLGRPTEVTLVNLHADGSATYSIPTPSKFSN